MAPTNTAELMQSVRECSTIAAQLVRHIDALRNLYRMWQTGLFDPNVLTAAQLEQLGLTDPSDITKLFDIVPTLDDLHNRSLIARGLAG